MLEPKDIKHGALIELYDGETAQWLPLSIISIVFDNVECRTLANEPILTTTSALIMGARLRPRDGSCRDCGDEAHDGPASIVSAPSAVPPCHRAAHSIPSAQCTSIGASATSQRSSRTSRTPRASKAKLYAATSWIRCVRSGTRMSRAKVA